LQHHVELAPAAVRDLRHVGRGPQLDRLKEALAVLSVDDPNTIPLVEAHGYYRRRVGDYRILFRPFVKPSTTKKVAGFESHHGYLVARVVHRSQLEAAIKKLKG
jgi:hypothetical protein